MRAWDAIYSVGAVRKMLWRAWYATLTRMLRDEEVLFLNYAFETDPPLGVPLAPEEERDRGCAQLYHHVAAQGAGAVAGVAWREVSEAWAGREVLEVSCGHGGGAAYLARRFRPARYVGLDLNAAGIAFCRRRHTAVAGLEFVRGDACALPFSDASFDVVLNVEASHCYPDFGRFLAEVARVLRPGGCFLYADFRFAEGGDIETWERTLAAETRLRHEGWREINDEVRRGMELNSARSLALIERHLPGFLRGAGRDFAGVKGSRVHEALARGEASYRSYRYVRE